MKIALTLQHREATCVGFALAIWSVCFAATSAASGGSPGGAPQGLVANSGWRLVREVEAPHGFVQAAAFSPDGRWLAVAGARPNQRALFHGPIAGTVDIIEVATGNVKRAFRSEEWGAACAVRFNPDGIVVAVWQNGPVVYWNHETGKVERALSGPSQSSCAAALASSAVNVAWSCVDGNIRIWDLKHQKRRVVLKAHVYCVLALSPDGRRLAVTAREIRTDKSSFTSVDGPEPVRIWNIRRQVVECELKKRLVNCLAFSPDRHVFATGDQDGVVRLWQIPNGQPFGPSLVAYTDRHCGSMIKLAFSPNGKLLASATCDAKVKVWNVQSGALVAVLSSTDQEKTYSQSLFSIPTFSPSGKTLAVATEDGIVTFWKAN